MNQDTIDKKTIEYLNSTAKRISFLVKEGYTKGQISEYFHKKHESASESIDSSELVEFVTKLNDIVDRMIDTAIFVHAKNNLQPEIRKFCQQIDDEKNLSYIGKDGRDYYSSETLENANKQYAAQMYTENKPRTM